MTMGDRLKALRTAAGLDQPRTAAIAGTSKQYVSQLESGRNKNPRAEFVEAWARHFGVSVQWLATGKGDKSAQPAMPQKIRAYSVRAVVGTDDIDPDTEVMVDKVDVLLSGGPGNYVPDFVETKFQMAYRLEWFQKKGAKPDRCKLFQVEGHSMEGLLWHGDLALVDLDDTRVRSGKVYALAIGNEVKVKRLFTRRDGGLRVVSDNPDKTLYPDEEVPTDEMDSVAIIGRIIDKHGAGGL